MTFVGTGREAAHRHRVWIGGAVSTECLAGCALLLVMQLSQTVAAPVIGAVERLAQVESSQATAGLLLLTELSCTACHLPTRDQHDRLAAKGGPNLRAVGMRLTVDWMRQFLMAPQAVKPGTTMPDMLIALEPAQRRHAANCLAAYLATQRQPYTPLEANGGNPVQHEFWNRGDISAGRMSYLSLGCVACHDAGENTEAESTLAKLPIQASYSAVSEDVAPKPEKDLDHSDAGRPIPLVGLSEKYTRYGLARFLLDPHSVRPSGRMPDFQLSPNEAGDLVAFLTGAHNRSSRQPGSSLVGHDKNAAASMPENSGLVSPEEFVDQGKRMFEHLGCVSCHLVSEPLQSVTAAALSELQGKFVNPNRAEPLQSCWTLTGRMLRTRPYFDLEPWQQAAVTAGLQRFDTNIPSIVDFHMLQRGCLACHERNGEGGVARGRRVFFRTVNDVDFGDEGRLPPSLTGVGAKLKTDWITKVLSGSGRVRPHMRARMPGFPADSIRLLPRLLHSADRPRFGETELTASETSGKRHSATSEELNGGRALLDVGCIQCHPIRGATLPGVVGVDLGFVTQRMDADWFKRFVLDPASLKSRTRMPTFFPNGQSQVPHILGGDAERQIAAIWHYLSDVDHQLLPPKIEEARRQNYELTPTTRPIMLRTFMEQAGTHAIAVGFPAGVHFAFDASSNALVQAWRGRFLDARGTWFVRAAPPAQPLGNDIITLDGRPSLAILPKSSAGWTHGARQRDGLGFRFMGYRLDGGGVPTFTYRSGDFVVEDRVVPGPGQSLVRTLSITRYNDHLAEAVKSSNLRGSQSILLFRAIQGKSEPVAASDGDESKWLERIRSDGLAVSVRGNTIRDSKVIGEPAQWWVELSATPTGTTAEFEVRYQW